MSANSLRATGLNRRIRIEKRVEVKDSYGAVTYTYALRCEVYARVVLATPREGLLANEITATATHEFHIRYRSDILETDRVVWKGQHYALVGAPVEQGRNVWLKVFAKMPGGEEGQ